MTNMWFLAMHCEQGIIPQHRSVLPVPDSYLFSYHNFTIQYFALIFRLIVITDDDSNDTALDYEIVESLLV